MLPMDTLGNMETGHYHSKLKGDLLTQFTAT